MASLTIAPVVSCYIVLRQRCLHQSVRGGKKLTGLHCCIIHSKSIPKSRNRQPQAISRTIQEQRTESCYVMGR